MPLVEKWWFYHPLRGWPGYGFMEKLNSLKGELKRWNKEVFGNVGLKKASLLRAIEIIDRKKESIVLSTEEIDRRKFLKESLTETIVQEQRIWPQKGKLTWLQEGDENSNFFHRWSSHKKNRAYIGELQDELGNVLNKGEGEAEFLRYFSSLYTTTADHCFMMENVGQSPLPMEQNSHLEAPFTEEEISRAIADLGNLKSPRPDAMTN